MSSPLYEPWVVLYRSWSPVWGRPWWSCGTVTWTTGATTATVRSPSGSEGPSSTTTTCMVGADYWDTCTDWKSHCWLLFLQHLKWWRLYCTCFNYLQMFFHQRCCFELYYQYYNRASIRWLLMASSPTVSGPGGGSVYVDFSEDPMGPGMSGPLYSWGGGGGWGYQPRGRRPHQGGFVQQGGGFTRGGYAPRGGYMRGHNQHQQQEYYSHRKWCQGRDPALTEWRKCDSGVNRTLHTVALKC